MQCTTTDQVGLAICRHFGLSPNGVLQDYSINTGRDEVFTLSLRLALTADDLAGISDHMPGRTVTILDRELSKPVPPAPVRAPVADAQDRIVVIEGVMSKAEREAVRVYVDSYQKLNGKFPDSKRVVTALQLYRAEHSRWRRFKAWIGR